MAAIYKSDYKYKVAIETHGETQDKGKWTILFLIFSAL